MTKFRLTIKGNEQDAEHAAEARGLKVSDVKRLSFNQVVATCEADYQQLASWFVEPTGTFPESTGTFPVGTLLLYNEEPDHEIR